MPRQYLVVGFFIAIFSLVGCGSNSSFVNAPAGETDLLQTDFDSKLILDMNVLIEQGSAPETAEVASYSKAGPSSKRWRLRQGTKLVGLLDTECMNQHRHGISHEISDSFDSTPIKRKAYSFALKREMDFEELSAQLERDPCVLQVGNDVEVQAVGVPNDPSFSNQWHHRFLESAAGYDYFYGAEGISKDVVIAIVDTGVEYTHPDLRDNMWVSSRGFYGRDFINNDDDPRDDHGHGTHCAGLAGATMNNGVGGSGVAGARTRIMALKALNASGSGSTSQIVNALNFAVENGADIVSFSLGHRGRSSVFQRAIQDAVNKGVVVFAAAGNDRRLVSSSNFYSPAGYAKDIDGFISVGAIGSNGARSSFSNYSPSYIEMSAPGSSILSTVLNGRYATYSGTSMSTPIAAGAAGLVIGMLKSKNVKVTAGLVEEILRAGSVKSSALSRSFVDGNTLNLRTLAQATSSELNGAPSEQQPAPQPEPEPMPEPVPEPIPEPTPEPPVADCGGMTQAACEVVRLTNIEREKRGRQALGASAACASMAQSHADDMARNGFFSHTSPTQGSFSMRLRTFGVRGSAGENIAAGSNLSAARALSLWMNSSGHRRNILNSRFRSMGAGVAMASNGRSIYYVQCFSGSAQ